MNEATTILMLDEAYRHARFSPDKSNQNGAILYSLKDEKVVGYGYNSFFNGVKPVLTDRDQKLARITHAEEAAIACGWGAKGPLVLFCPWAACAGCARDIINCRGGIVKLVVHKPRMDTTPERWVKDIEYAHAMIEEAGIKVEVYEPLLPPQDPPLDGTDPDWNYLRRVIKVNGEDWSPCGDKPRVEYA